MALSAQTSLALSGYQLVQLGGGQLALVQAAPAPPPPPQQRLVTIGHQGSLQVPLELFLQQQAQTHAPYLLQLVQEPLSQQQQLQRVQQHPRLVGLGASATELDASISPTIAQSSLVSAPALPRAQQPYEHDLVRKRSRLDAPQEVLVRSHSMQDSDEQELENGGGSDDKSLKPDDPRLTTLREKNKMAQRRYRDRRRMLLTDLEEETALLEYKLLASTQELQRLQEENSALKAQLAQAEDCVSQQQEQKQKQQRRQQPTEQQKLQVKLEVGADGGVGTHQALLEALMSQEELRHKLAELISSRG